MTEKWEEVWARTDDSPVFTGTIVANEIYPISFYAGGNIPIAEYNQTNNTVTFNWEVIESCAADEKNGMRIIARILLAARNYDKPVGFV
jgi:hypothetical protein